MKTKKPMIPRINLLLSPRKVNMKGVDRLLVVVGFIGLEMIILTNILWH